MGSKTIIFAIMLAFKSYILISQNTDSIFNSIDQNFNISIENQNKLFNFYNDDFNLWKDKVDLKKLSLEAEKAKVNTYNIELSSRTKVLEEVNKYIGVPYIWGGSNPNGFDCSGLIQWTIKKTHDIIIPRTTKMQSSKWKKELNYNLNEIKLGDFIYFKSELKNEISHVGIYTDKNKFIHAPNRNEKVKISHINSYWKSLFAGFISLDFIIN